MTNPTTAAGTPAADPYLRGESPGGWSAQADQRTLERERLESRAKGTDATLQLLRCFPSWTRALEQLTFRTLERLAANEPVDPNDPDGWRNRDAHAQAVLHRHGKGKLSARRLTSAAITDLIDGQAVADRDAGLDWSTVTTPASALDERLARAHGTLPVDLDDPGVWTYQLDQRRVLARPLGLDDCLADDLSRWLLANPSQFDAGDLRCWRIGSDSWLSLAGEQLGTVGTVERPVGVFVVPAIGSSDGWQLTPVLALDTIRLVAELGGRLERDLRSAVIPIGSRDALLERINVHTLHAGPRECLDSAGQLAQELSRELGVPVNPGAPRDKRDRWGRLAVRRRSYKGADGTKTAQLELRVLSFPARGFTQRQLGSAPREEQSAHPSAVMDLGEAVQTAVDAGLPLLLSSEAAGQLKDTVRVGRMKGRPGMLTITTSDGVSATTRRLVAEQALGELRALKRARAKVTLAAGARQVVRMTLAQPLADDPVLLGRQREMAALKVVGSGVDASAVGTGKCCAPDTPVYVNGSLVSIEEIWQRYCGTGLSSDGAGDWSTPTRRLVTNSVADDGRIVPSGITAIYRQRVNELGRRVTLDDGSSITITQAHRLLSQEGWTDQFVAGDFVCVPRVLRWDGELLSHHLAELVAWQVAEGYEVDRTDHAGFTDRVLITQKNIAVLERLRRLARTVGERHQVAMGRLTIGEPAGRAATLTISGTESRRLLERELGYQWGRRSANKRIPDGIMEAEDLTVAVFLRAFFDAEGSVARGNRGVVEITSASAWLMAQLSTLLRRFGIWLRIARKEKGAANGANFKRPYWTGYIGGPSLRAYAEQIGFGDSRKSERLARACSAPTNTNVQGVPIRDIIAGANAAGCNYSLAQPVGAVTGATVGIERALRMLRSYRATIASSTEPGGNAALDPRIRNAIRRVDTDSLNQIAERLEGRLAQEVFYAKVRRVEEVTLDGWVYDLEVADHHNFVAGGMLAHNTISSGRALAHRASTQPRFRGLVVAEGRLLGQWRDELTRGAPGRQLPPLAPNLELLVLSDDRQIAGQIRRFDRELGDRPGVALVPNSVLDRYPADLQAIPWHLLIADEALRYANPATEAHQALAQVRFGSVADCWLLTATPRGKSAEHLDVLVGLAVGDQAMITERLNTREAGDLMDEIHAHRLRVNYGPHLVRVTRADMQAWMPEVRPAQPLALDPDPALTELLDAIRRGGQEAYRRLLGILRELKSLEAGSALYKQALAELARAQGVVLGNVGTFVTASCDPAALMHSKAALAKALVRQGLVQEAMRGGGDGLPLLRGVVAQTLAGVASDEQALVFCDRVWCLRYLASTLRERHGLDARVADGSTGTREFEELKRRFTAGEFPVMCLSPIGQEGHNLQAASVLVHLDLPWVPMGLEQRVGRAARPGAARGWVQTYIPYIRGGGIEHVVSVLSPRGGEHHQLLDSFEGVPAAESTIAMQLAEITGQVAEARHAEGFAVSAARLRVASAVFGAT